MACVEYSNGFGHFQPFDVQKYREEEGEEVQKHKIPFDVKRLQCWYWAHRGNCTWGDRCRYAHYDTGKVAEKPVRLGSGLSVAGRNATTERPIYKKWQGLSHPKVLTSSQSILIRNEADYISTEHLNINEHPYGWDEHRSDTFDVSFEPSFREQRKVSRGRSRSPARNNHSLSSTKPHYPQKTRSRSPRDGARTRHVDKQGIHRKFPVLKTESIGQKNNRHTISRFEETLRSGHEPASRSLQPANTGLTFMKDLNSHISAPDMGNMEYSRFGRLSEVDRHDASDSMASALPVDGIEQSNNLAEPRYRESDDWHYPVYSHPHGVPNPNNTHMTLTVEQWSQIQDQLAESKQQIESLRTALFSAHQTLEKYRFIIDRASTVLENGVSTLSNHGSLAMDICQKIQRGSPITQDEVTDTWLNANELLRQAEKFLSAQGEWAQLHGTDNHYSTDNREKGVI